LEWEVEACEALAESGVVRLSAIQGNETQLRDALIRLIATPVDVGFLQFFPAVEQVRRDGEGITVTLVLREVA
jgi:hypothetical protein